MKNAYVYITIAFFGLLGLMFLAAVALMVVPPLVAEARPTVVIAAPASGTDHAFGQDIAVQSLSSDPQGIQQVELLVDGAVVRTNVSPMSGSTPQFQLVQTWNANQLGNHVLKVRATNARGQAAEAAISINVVGQNGATPGATAQATLQPPATLPPATLPPVTQAPGGSGQNNTGPVACSADFVADVTIPDGTAVPAGGAFVKTWRVRNSGCAWDAGFSMVWTAGEQMGAASPSLIPVAPTGATIDLSLAMVAPATAGAHTSEWRLRAADGSLFGPKLTVMINVSAPPDVTPPPADPTVPPPPPPPPPPEAPAAPSNFQANGTGTTIHLSWTDNSTNEAGFRIFKAGDPAPVVTVPPHIGSGAMAYDWTERPCNLSATYYVKAFNDGGESGASNSDSAVTIPCAPTGFSANGTGTTVQFSWSDNSGIESGFRIYQSGVAAPVQNPAAHAGTGATNHNWPGRPCNLSATYYVKAFNSAGESAASNANAAVTIPCAPTGFGAVGASASSVNVSFVDNATNEAGFRVYRTGAAGVLETLSAHAGTGAKSGVVNPVICGQTYSYYVKAYNSAGESSASNTNDGATFACNVVVNFTSVHVYDDTDSPGAGEIWLNLTVNGTARRWPSSGEVSVNSGETKAIAGTSVSLNLMRTTNLTISVKGSEDDFMINDDLGTATATYTGASGWSEGSHCTESAGPHKFRICYGISVTP